MRRIFVSFIFLVLALFGVSSFFYVLLSASLAAILVTDSYQGLITLLFAFASSSALHHACACSANCALRRAMRCHPGDIQCLQSASNEGVPLSDLFISLAFTSIKWPHRRAKTRNETNTISFCFFRRRLWHERRSMARAIQSMGCCCG
jgi:hypothetical protein